MFSNNTTPVTVIEFPTEEDVANEVALVDFVQVSLQAEAAALRTARRIRAHRHWAVEQDRYLTGQEQAARRARVTAITTGRIPRDDM